jgi:hypothetical protein
MARASAAAAQKCTRFGLPTAGELGDAMASTD